MSLEDRIKDYLKRLQFRSIIVLALLVLFVIIFVALWATMGFDLPAFLTDVKLIEKASLFALWTIGAILFGLALATFILSRGLGNALKGK
jgi:hypothetical protein